MNIKTAVAAGLLALAICVPVQAQQAPTLYKRLGGYDALAAVTDWIGGNEQPDDITLVFARAQ